MIGTRRLAVTSRGVRYMSLAAGVAFALGAAALAAQSVLPGGTTSVTVRTEAMHPAAFFDEHQFAQSLALANGTPADPMTGARAVIIPHHWVGGSLILAALRDLAAAGTYDRIILIGPNHTNAGGAPVTTSDLAWSTPFGTIRPDTAALSSLGDSVLLSVDPDVLTYEHSVAGIMPAIAYYLPSATVLPLALDASLSPGDVDALATALTGLMDERTVLIAAVDFSHYLPAERAHLNDAESISALSTLDTARVMAFGNEHMDSPTSVAIAMGAARKAGAGTFRLLENSDSAVLTGGASASVTSYVSGYYR